MKNKLSLSTDRKSAAEGELIDIKWNCDACPDSLMLSIDSGYKCNTIAVAYSGSTRVALSRSKGKTTITLKAVISGKKVSETVVIRVKNAKTFKPSKGSGISKIKLWKEKLQAGWYVYRANLKYWWLSRKKWQKTLWITLLALWLGMLISSLTCKPKVTVPSGETQTSSITILTERPSYFA